MAEYINICKECFHSYVCERYYNIKDGNIPECLFMNDHFVPAADVVEVKTLKAWLYAIAMNNVGAPIEDMASACEEIANRLDGLRAFAREEQ